MAEYGYPLEQTIAGGQSAIFYDIEPCAKGYVLHREGSGIVTLRGIAAPCKRFVKYTVQFNGNIAVAEGGTPGEISVAIAINGEPLQTSLAAVTPAAVGNYFNVTSVAKVDVPVGCCTSITIDNTTDPSSSITMRNANLVVDMA